MGQDRLQTASTPQWRCGFGAGGKFSVLCLCPLACWLLWSSPARPPLSALKDPWAPLPLHRGWVQFSVCVFSSLSLCSVLSVAGVSLASRLHGAPFHSERGGSCARICFVLGESRDPTPRGYSLGPQGQGEVALFLRAGIGATEKAIDQELQVSWGHAAAFEG